MTADGNSIIGEIKDAVGRKIHDALVRKKYPSVDIPSHSTTNIIYDEKNTQWSLGDKTVTRSSGTLTGAKSMMHLAWMAKTASEYVRQGKTATKREIYYQSMEDPLTKFDEQADSDSIIVDLETMLGRPREDFNVQPEDRNKVFGDLIIQYTDPKFPNPVSLMSSPDGQVIGHNVARAKIVKSNVKMVIISEKGGIFTRCVEDGIHEKYNALLFDTTGQATRNARLLLARLASELNVPMYIFTDADPWGEHIARVLMGGSAESAHLVGLTIPKAQWLGTWATDITTYDLPTMELKERDVKKCNDMLKDPRYREGIWKREVEEFLRIKKKAELEAFSRKGLTFITDEYIPEKIEMAQRGAL